MVVEKKKREVLGWHRKKSHRFICHLFQAISSLALHLWFSVTWFHSSRPANVCITSVPKMGRVLSNGWTGSRTVSLMPDTMYNSSRRGIGTHIARQKKSMEPCGTDNKSSQGLRIFCLFTQSPLAAVATSP